MWNLFQSKRDGQRKGEDGVHTCWIYKLTSEDNSLLSLLMGWSLATKRDKAKSSKESCPNLLCLAAYMATYPSLPPFPTLHPTTFLVISETKALQIRGLFRLVPFLVLFFLSPLYRDGKGFFL
jgi:hypothetical protein